MREALAPLCWRRHRFTAVVGPRGNTPAGPAICLRAVADAETGDLLCCHVWVLLGCRNPPALSAGRRVAFRATVRPYTRANGDSDYHLAGLRHVVALPSIQAEEVA